MDSSWRLLYQQQTCPSLLFVIVRTLKLWSSCLKIYKNFLGLAFVGFIIETSRQMAWQLSEQTLEMKEIACLIIISISSDANFCHSIHSSCLFLHLLSLTDCPWVIVIVFFWLSSFVCTLIDVTVLSNEDVYHHRELWYRLFKSLSWSLFHLSVAHDFITLSLIY